MWLGNKCVKHAAAGLITILSIWDSQQRYKTGTQEEKWEEPSERYQADYNNYECMAQKARKVK